MRKEMKNMKELLKRELDMQRENRRQELLAMKVSPPSHCSNLHHCTVIHYGADFMS
jgi:hypothetical protein